MDNRLLIIGIAASSLLLGSLLTLMYVAHSVPKELIARGLAEYCATDGRFAFKGECP